jgi:hypothetical protein
VKCKLLQILSILPDPDKVELISRINVSHHCSGLGLDKVHYLFVQFTRVSCPSTIQICSHPLGLIIPHVGAGMTQSSSKIYPNISEVICKVPEPYDSFKKSPL